MKLIDLLPTRPKSRIRLDPIDPEDLHVDIDVVNKWSRNNSELVHLLLQNGMATFICNYDFIHEHYEELIFINRNILSIDQKTLLFKNLITLNLCENNIKTLQNIPQSLQQLYVDFNRIDQIKLTKEPHTKLVLLSISNNCIENGNVQCIQIQYPNLRSLNVANNLITDIRGLVKSLKSLTKLKILSVYQNPIAMLKIYYQYLTENLQLRVFDGEKYQKPEPIKKNIEIPKVEVKEEVKEEKKDPKKDNKKGGKQPQPVKQEKPKIQPVKEQKKKQLTEDDFTKFCLHLTITNFQNFTGNLYEASLFPADFDLEKIQTTFWLEYQLMGLTQNTQSRKVRFDEATVVENEPCRLSFGLNIVQDFAINFENRQRLSKGILIAVFSEQPKMQVSAQGGQLKPVKENDQILMKRTKVGEVFIDLRQLFVRKQKELQKLYYLWEPQICSRPYFKNPLGNQKQEISKRKDQHEQRLKKEEQERLKRIQEQQAAKTQKKGSKDAKKAEKKPQKKQGKQVPVEKKMIEKSNYPLDGKIYCYLNDNILYKAKKQTLAVKVWIE